MTRAEASTVWDPRRSLRAKVALGLAALGLIFTVLMAALAQRVYQEELSQSAGRALAYSAQQVAGNLQLRLAERLVELQQIAARLSEPGALDDHSALRRGLEQVSTGRSDYVWLGITGADGQVWAAKNGMLEGRDVRQRAWFAAGRVGPFVGDVHEALLLQPLLPPSPDGEPYRLIDLATPVTDARGQLVAVVGAHLDWRWVEALQAHLLSDMAADHGMESLILTRAGRVLGGPASLRNQDLSALLAAARDNTAPKAQRWPDGHDYLTALSVAPTDTNDRAWTDLGWHIVVRQPLDKALTTGTELRRNLLLGGVAMVLLLALSSWRLAGRLARPLVRLAEVARGLQSGDAVHFSDVRTGAHDEVGALAQSLVRLDDLRRDEMLQRQQIAVRYKTLIDHSPDAIYINEGGRLTLINQAGLTLFGATHPDQLLGKTPYDLFAPPDHAVIKARVHQLVDLGNPVPLIDQRIVRLDGRWVDVEVSAAPFETGGRRALVVLLRDITERKQAQQLLAQREEALRQLNAELEQRVQARTTQLSTANQELDSFAYAVSHDLRAPLRAINGFAVALEEDSGHLLDDAAHEHLRQIRWASQRMADLIDGLLSLSRTVRGPLRHDQVDVSRLAQDILTELAQGDPTATTRWQIEPGLTLAGDARMISSAVGNLLGNAWKYSRQADAPTIHLRSELRDGRRWVCIDDNGVGFDPAHGQRLFKPFQRLHRQDEFTGLGIGLATVLRIVQRHGGDITADGQPGRGARFCFTLDPAPPQHAAAPTPVTSQKDAEHEQPHPLAG